VALVSPDQFSFCGPTYLEPSPVLDAQQSINLYPDPGIATSKARMGLVGRPGLSLGARPSSATVGNSLWSGDNRLFAAASGHVFEINSSLGVITDYGSGLTSTKPSPMPFVAQGGDSVHTGAQLLVCDPVAGKVFYVNPAGPSLVPVFNGIGLDYLDGFMLSIATGSSLAGSNPNQVNASTFGGGGASGDWSSLAYAIRTGTSDVLLQLAVVNNLCWLFGQKNIEAWYDAGTSPFPLARVSGSTINIGCLAPASVVKFYNTVLWLGGDDRGYPQVYMLNGMNPVRVSNNAIEFQLSTFITSASAPFAKAFGYQEAGQTFYCLIPSNSSYQAGTTMFCYSLTTGLWHLRQYVLHAPTSFAAVSSFGSTTSNLVISEDAIIQYQSIQFASDAGVSGGTPAAINYLRASPHVTRDNSLTRYNRFELDGSFGTASPLLSWSNDGGRSFPTPDYVLAQSQDAIAPGTFQRFYKTQLGVSRDRVFVVTIQDSTNLIRIANALLDVN
jgi:hypothetical protein